MVTLCILVFSFSVLGCDNVALVGNGFCNDETNNADCNYDGGDCCVVNINTDSCSECICHLIETCAAGYHPLVRNGFCNDDTNIAGCDYDGGDCCGYNINSEHCTECTCFNLETCLAGVHPLVGDGVCNDETNIAGCDYDDGDCCGYNINSEHCTECTCFHQEACLAGVTHAFVGDGICNDETNVVECNYDGGDCCQNPNMVGNGICNGETNNLECNYDGGDCCGPAVSCKYFVWFRNIWHQSNDTILHNANIILKKVIPTAVQRP